MPIIDGRIVSTAMTSGPERSLQAAAKKYGEPFWKAYTRAMSVDYADPVMRQIFNDMMRDDDPGEFLMGVFGEPLDAQDAIDKALKTLPVQGNA